jgi:hypothetical protein
MRSFCAFARRFNGLWEFFSGREEDKRLGLGKLVRSDRVQGGRRFWFNAYTKQRRFGKRGNPNFSQNGAVLVRALIFFSHWEGIFVTWTYQNDVVWMFPSTFTAITNGGG